VRSAARALALAGFVAVALAGCSPPAGNGPAAGSGFSSRVSEDLSGEYAPAAPVAVGGKALEGLYLGHADDFAAYERGERVPGFAPVMLMLGGERVLPAAYRVTDDRVRFEGRAGGTPVRLEAEIDLDALAEARRTLGGDDAVITGTLRVGGESAPVAFSRATGG
jgi:hypothetical protein